jgi:signal transduction histidine kinase
MDGRLDDVKGMMSSQGALDLAGNPEPGEVAHRNLTIGSQGAIRMGLVDRLSSAIFHHQVMATSTFLAMVIVVWAVVNLASGWVGFAAFVPTGFRGGMEAGISLARLFAALVLILIIHDGVSERLRWVAAGFAVLGLGQLVFGYLGPILETSAEINDSLYQMILVRTFAGALIVAGILPNIVPGFSIRTVLGILLASGFFIAAYLLLDGRGAVPSLVEIESIEEAARLRIAPVSWFTPWHWIMAAIPLGLAVVAAAGSIGMSERGEVGRWLPISIVLLAGSELHDALWPSAYGNSELMNTADVLRLAMAVVVVVGGVIELRRIAFERAQLLAEEKKHSRQLLEVNTLRSDFTAMVAHELGYPLSAIRRLTEMLSRDGVDIDLRNHALGSILKETDALDTLVADIQATSVIERDDFMVQPRPVELGSLIRDAREMAADHPQHPPLEIILDRVSLAEKVLVDPDRMGQVLRNLLCNAAKYSPDGTQISVRAQPSAKGHIRMEVADCGPGIHEDDVDRVFEKFGRARNRHGNQVAGTGLGLYLSRRIMRAHGSDLTLQSTLGVGSVFAFEVDRC